MYRDVIFVGKMKNIMIVDDESNTLDWIKSCLNENEFGIITVNNSRQAIELMEGDKEDDFGLILINTLMPNTKTPALFSMKPKSKKDIDTSNESDFLQKPFTKEQFLNFIKEKIK